jgi:hypothetical protein
MLTDDDLTRQLGAAFEDDTRDKTYGGAVPRVRTRPAWVAPGWVALPAAGAVAAAVLVFGSIGDTAPPAAPDAGATTAAPSQATTTDGTVSEEIQLAGMTFTVRHQAGDDFSMEMLAVYAVDQVPAWAEPVELESGASAKVWVGQAPDGGRVSMFVESPVRWGGKLTGLASPDLSVEQMIEVAKTGTLS